MNYQYDNAGRILSRVMSSGNRSVYGYDTGGWLTSMSHQDSAGTVVSAQTYTRDHVGNITGLNTTAGASTGANSYTLDALYRLTAVNAPTTANSEAFSYDHLGNRITNTKGGSSIGATGSTTRYYNYFPATQTGNPGYTATLNNRLKEIRIGSASGTLDSSFVFDNEGRLTSQTGTSPRAITWDAKGRVHSLGIETYSYDPSSQRIGRTGGSLGNLAYYLEGDNLESVESAGVLLEKYFRGSGPDELVAGYTPQNGVLTPFLFQHDQVMSVSAETNPNGGTQAAMTYSAFGATQATTGTPISRLQFAGRENDGTGLYYNRARNYDPAIGRFISEDPKKFAAGINFYAYVGNNPINANDPSGLYQALQVTNPDGSTYIPMTTVKNKYQVPGYGLPIGTQTAIAVPPNVDPAAEVQRWSSALFNGPVPFAAYWFPNGTHDYKQTKAMYDAYGNFAYGATGSAAGYSLGVLQFAGDALKNFKNDPINKTDINSGFNAINNGGTLSTIEYTHPSLTPKIPADFGVKNPNSGWDDSSSGAAGGFLIYPNKPNTNQIQSVYSK